MSKLDILKNAENTEEGLCPDEIVELEREIPRYFPSNYKKSLILRAKYKEFYDDVKLDVSEDW